MKVLYVAPENVTGGFSLYAEGHRRRGSKCRWITFFHSKFSFEDDLCFELLAMPDKQWVRQAKKLFENLSGDAGIKNLDGNPPVWKPSTFPEYAFNICRDILNTPRINKSINKWRLNEFDLYMFEQGIDPYRSGKWVRELARKGKHIVCFYHGSDLRNRGVIPAVHKASSLNLTSEIDLLNRIPGMKYLYLPIDTDTITPESRQPDGRIRVCHAARNRFKGSHDIEIVVKKVAERYPVDWVMIENQPFKRALEIKASCDIFIDQITDAGGWGYGASSVESLALGIPTMTLINPEVDNFLGDHPFVSVHKETLEAELIKLIKDSDLRRELSERGREWVIDRHGIDSVMDTLYGYYDEAGML